MPKKYQEKSLQINMVLNAIKALMGVLFPLITFKYVSQIIGVDNLGFFSFSSSVVSYFVLLANLGISTYAIREGAKLRDNYLEFGRFANQIFSISFFSTVISYFFFCLLLLTVPKFKVYTEVLLILSINIIMSFCGVEWIFSAFEDFKYITIRSILIQLVALVLIFVFIRSDKDINTYAFIMVFSVSGSHLLNQLFARKYCRLRITRNMDTQTHLKPILHFFAMQATISIYVNSDTTILGFLCNDHTVGIYSVSTKIYVAVKTVIAAVLTVSIPRLSSFVGRNENKDFSIEASKIYKILISFMLPVVTGLIVIRKEIISIISTSDFSKAESSLMILSFALVFCMGAWFWGQCILIPYMKENLVFKITILSAIINVVLNLYAIPFWKENAAAFTTVISQFIAYFLTRRIGKQFVNLNGINAIVLKSSIGCVPIIIIYYMICKFDIDMIYRVIIVTLLSSVLYYGIETVLKNEAVMDIRKSIQTKMLS